MDGWIKLHRKILENPIVSKDSDYLSVWIYLLLNATHKETSAWFKGEKITLKPGQLITGRKQIASKLGVTESKIQRILSCYESEHQIEQQTSNKNRLISVVNWEFYQSYEQQIEQQMNIQRTSSEQPVNTNKNVKNEKNVRNNNNNNNIARFVPPDVEMVRAYCEERNNSIDPQAFIDHYTANGWMRGKTKIKDWKACVRTWERNRQTRPELPAKHDRISEVDSW